VLWGLGRMRVHRTIYCPSFSSLVPICILMALPVSDCITVLVPRVSFYASRRTSMVRTLEETTDHLRGH
jgi:hypothetical protein